MGLVEVYRGSGGAIRSAFLSAALEEQGIPCVVSGAGIAGYPMTVGPMGEFTIQVEVHQADIARDLLEALTTEIDFESEENLVQKVPAEDEEDERVVTSGTVSVAAGFWGSVLFSLSLLGFFALAAAASTPEGPQRTWLLLVGAGVIVAGIGGGLAVRAVSRWRSQK